MGFNPCAIKNIQLHCLFEKKSGDIYCIGNIEADKYIFLNKQQADAVMQAICYMDGTNTIEDIEEIMLREHHITINITKLCEILAGGGLLVPSDEMEIQREFNEIQTLFVTIKTFSLKKIVPFLRIIPKADKALFAILILSVVVSMFLFSHTTNPLFSIRDLFSEPRVLIYYLMISTASILLHEMGHVIIGTYYGLTPSTMTIAAYAYVTPLIYVKLPGIYFLSPGQRLVTWLAGIFLNLSVLLFTYSLSFHVDGEAKLILLVTAYCNLSIIIFSLNPLLYSDGYYAFSTILKTPNLRKSSGKCFLKILTGKAKLEDYVYSFYFFIVIVLAIVFIVPECIYTVQSLITDVQRGVTIVEIFKSFSNIFIMVVIGMLAMIFSKSKNRPTGE